MHGVLETSDAYLERHQTPFVLRDVVHFLLLVRDERPLDLLAEYFAHATNGSHVLMREFDFVNSSCYNRWAFISSAREAFCELCQVSPMTATSLTQLLRLICPDFPLDLVRDACLFCGENSDVPSTYPLARLLHATCVRLCFPTLRHQIADTFAHCDTSRRGRLECNAIGQMLSQRSLAASATWPPSNLFDDLLASSGDISLIELQQRLVYSTHMYRLLIGSCTALVTSPMRSTSDVYVHDFVNNSLRMSITDSTDSSVPEEMHSHEK